MQYFLFRLHVITFHLNRKKSAIFDFRRHFWASNHSEHYLENWILSIPWNFHPPRCLLSPKMASKRRCSSTKKIEICQLSAFPCNFGGRAIEKSIFKIKFPVYWPIFSLLGAVEEEKMIKNGWFFTAKIVRFVNYLPSLAILGVGP